MLQPLWRVVVPKKAPVVHAVHLRGVIAARAGPRGISFANTKDLLEAAFRGSPHPPDAVALVVNSPGGSPVQSNLITQKLDELATKTKIPTMAFAEDVAASGGYWLLCAAQEVHCDPASIVGSIGVVSGNFGLHGLMERMGVERRVLAAGVHKVRNDPFLPTKPEDVAKMTAVLESIHGVFKAHVRAKRGAKIEGKEESVFSGDFWVGKEAVDLGLVDSIGSLHQVAKQRFGEDVVVRDMNPKPRFPFLPPWFGGGGGVGGVGGMGGAGVTTGAASLAAATVVEEAVSCLEDRLDERLWRARVGLE